MHAHGKLFWLRTVIMKPGKNIRSLHKLFYRLTEMESLTTSLSLVHRVYIEIDASY